MSLCRTFDPAFLNEVVNHPEVRPWLGKDRVSPIDMSAVVENPVNVVLVNDHGGFVFYWREPYVYEVHTQFLPSGRGPQAQEAAREAVRYMFKAISADKILTDVPEDNGPALGLALKTGFKIASNRFDHGGEYSGKAQRIHELELTRARFEEASRHWADDTMPAQNEGARQCL